MTMKQREGASNLDPIEASKNLRHFLNRLNTLAFGNAFRRYGKRVEVVAVQEVSIGGRLHYHLAMKNPFETLEECEAAICRCWAKTRWGYDEVDVRPIFSSGWISYITKERRIDGWDVENTHLVR
ncbi:hypothetical protein [Yoonia sp.]|uniref:rolling circle replication-associated protein n=1 Tax=Yoonia sp. TaxID=2212373 RepID=UPI00358ED836